MGGVLWMGGRYLGQGGRDLGCGGRYLGWGMWGRYLPMGVGTLDLDGWGGRYLGQGVGTLGGGAPTDTIVLNSIYFRKIIVILLPLLTVLVYCTSIIVADAGFLEEWSQGMRGGETNPPNLLSFPEKTQNIEDHYTWRDSL